jgi:hypothetical protein
MAADPTVIPLGSWGQEVAAVECAQIFHCCDATELMSFHYADEAQCRQMVADSVQKATSENVAYGQIVYDAKAARRCIDETSAVDCMHLPPYGAGYVLGPSCAQAVHGALPEGAACEDLDAICQSGNCTGTCAAPRPCWNVTCDAGQYCDPTLNACTPTLADGAACAEGTACTAPSACVAGVCGASLPDGASCHADEECASGGPCSPSATPGVDTCQPRVCDGV